ncbi:MAG: chemotaxis protein CheW, partial [Chlorobiaceae bacterium]|nr:chemotaxis protein CheW [Chlorobiaceae bacterium]
MMGNKVESSEILQLVSFKLGEEEYGVDILKVHEINHVTQLTKVPNAPNFVDGVINLRGKVIPVIDFRTLLRLNKREHDKDTRIIVVEISGKTIGFIVDAVKEVMRIPVNITEPPPNITVGADSSFIHSVGKLKDRLLILIDLEKIFSEQDQEKIKEI